MTNSPLLFDHAALRRHKNRAARRGEHFLFEEAAERLGDRLADFTRSFPEALEIGARNGIMTRVLKGRGAIQSLTQMDASCAMLKKANGMRVTAEPEELPFAEGKFDLVISAGGLHWVNDLPGALVQIRRALKPDGLLLAMMPGGETLKELRQSLEAAEMEITGGISPRISPFIDVRDGGALLQRAGFAMPVCDSEKITVTYEHPLLLLKDLREMGEANALLSRQKHFTARSLLLRAMGIYKERFSDKEGRVVATFELVTLTGWRVVS